MTLERRTHPVEVVVAVETSPDRALLARWGLSADDATAIWRSTAKVSPAARREALAELDDAAKRLWDIILTTPHDVPDARALLAPLQNTRRSIAWRREALESRAPKAKGRPQNSTDGRTWRLLVSVEILEREGARPSTREVPEIAAAIQRVAGAEKADKPEGRTAQVKRLRESYARNRKRRSPVAQ